MVSVYLAAEAEVRAALAECGLTAVTSRLESDRVVVGLAADDRVAAVVRLRRVLGEDRVESGDQSLPRLVAATLTAAGATLALAESCTGGLVAKLLTDLPGSSAFLLGGVVAYANEAKVRLLNVAPQLIARYGAVSGPVVEAMARGASRALGAGFAAAISGVAGPDGGTADKPVGTVWVAAGGPGDQVESSRYLFAGDRARIRELAAGHALLMVLGRVRAQGRDR